MEFLQELWTRTLFGGLVLVSAAVCVMSGVLYAMTLLVRNAMSRFPRGRVWVWKAERVLRKLHLVDSV